MGLRNVRASVCLSVCVYGSLLYIGRVPESQVHVHCSGLFLPRDAAKKIWPF